MTKVDITTTALRALAHEALETALASIEEHRDNDADNFSRLVLNLVAATRCHVRGAVEPASFLAKHGVLGQEAARKLRRLVGHASAEHNENVDAQALARYVAANEPDASRLPLAIAAIVERHRQT